MAFSSARILPIFIMLPFLNSNTLNNSIRVPVAMLLGLSLWPKTAGVKFDFQAEMYFGLLVKESMIGLLLGCLISLPFWVLHAAGCIIDNQRGATISSSIDPVSGVDTSELANFFNIFCAAIFLQSGGLILTLEVIKESYDLFEPLTFTLPNMIPLLNLITEVISRSIMVASPLIALFLLTEATLGLLSRYAPQMNAFSLALTVKSFLGFLLLIIYFHPIFSDSILPLIFTTEKLQLWK